MRWVSTTFAARSVSAVFVMMFSFGALSAGVADPGDTTADVGIEVLTSSQVVPGQTTGYSILLVNHGPETAVNVVLTAAVPAGTTFHSGTKPDGWTCNAPPIGGTGTVTCSIAKLIPDTAGIFSLIVDVPLSATGTITDTFTVSTASTDLNAANNTGGGTITITPFADVGIHTTDSPDPVLAAASITYTFTMTNFGPHTAENAQFVDNLAAGTTFESFSAPDGWNCTTPAVGSGGTITCTMTAIAIGAVQIFTLRAHVPSATTGIVLNHAVVSTTSTQPLIDPNNVANQETTVATSADLSVTKSGTPASVRIGDEVTYTILLTNNGPSDATGVDLVDDFPVGVTFISGSGPAGWNDTLVSGATATFGLVGRVTAAAANPFVNKIVVTSATPDPNADNNSATVTNAIATEADVAIAAVVGAGPFATGGHVDYNLTVTNDGPDAATGVTVTNTLPTGATFVSATPSQGSCVGAGPVTCTIATLTEGASVTIHLVVTAPATPGSLTDTVTVTAAQTDPDSTNNSSSATATVVASAVIPTLSQWALIALGAALAVFGALVLKSP